MSDMTKLVCWIETHEHHHDAESHGTAIVFATTEARALVKARKWHGWGKDEPVHGVRRAPEFDHCADAGEVSAEALLAAGWWMHCGNCGNRVEEEGREDDETGEWIDPVCVGTDAYCSQSCLDSLVADQQENKRKKEATRAAFERRTHGVVEVVDCYSHMEGGTLDFKIPAGITTGRFKWSDQEPDGSFWCNPHDVRKFLSLRAAMRRHRTEHRYDLGCAG